MLKRPVILQLTRRFTPYTRVYGTYHLIRFHSRVDLIAFSFPSTLTVIYRLNKTLCEGLWLYQKKFEGRWERLEKNIFSSTTSLFSVANFKYITISRCVKFVSAMMTISTQCWIELAVDWFHFIALPWWMWLLWVLTTASTECRMQAEVTGFWYIVMTRFMWLVRIVAMQSTFSCMKRAVVAYEYLAMRKRIPLVQVVTMTLSRCWIKHGVGEF